MSFGEPIPARRLKEIASLSQRKYRHASGQTVVEGLRFIESARSGGAEITEVVLTPEMSHDEALLAWLEGIEVPAFVVSSRDFGRISTVKTSQGILAVVRVRWSALEALFALDRLIALDAVQDPGNAGTIVRTAAWTGVQGVLAGPGTADLFSPKAIRSSAGGVWDVRIAQCQDLAGILSGLASDGFTVTVADLDGLDVQGWRPAARAVLVLGNEGAGVSSDLRQVAHEAVTIPRWSGVRATESLNVGAASAIIMHRWFDVMSGRVLKSSGGPY